MVMHNKSFSVDINEELSEAFSAQVDERGYTKYRAIEGALRAFMSIPSEAQVALISDNENAYNILVKTFRNEDGVVYSEEEDFHRRVCEVLDDIGVLRVKTKHPRRAKTSKP